MTTKKEVIRELEFLSTLNIIVETYEEIAASRMQRIRSSVLLSRDFLYEINAIFQEVKTSYKEAVEKLTKRNKTKKASQPSFLKHNGKTLCCLVSANSGLYGDIIRRTFRVFLDNFRREKSEVAIIGRIGRQLFQEKFGFSQPFAYFELSDNKVDIEELKKITAVLIQYEKVLVFYGQFHNILSQTPLVTSISGDNLPLQQEEVRTKYFFEPSLEKILAFFEKEIFASIFEQVIFESELAKFASRILALDKVVENTQEKVKQVMFQKERIRHELLNKKQAEGFANIWIRTTGKL